MRSLAVYLKNYKKETILAPFFKFLEVVFDLMVPVVIAHMIDVGIAEEHAVSFAAGLALGGVVPVVAIYSSFLQRAVDQMLHDVSKQNLHVNFQFYRPGHL